jgi:uncharacterized protein (TIGR00159 family)
MNELKPWLFDPQWTQFLLKLKAMFLNPTNITDVGLVLALVYMMLLVIAERRTLWMVRGFIFLMVAAALSQWLHLKLLSFVLNNLVIGSAVAMAVILQSEVRRFLEQLGRGELLGLLRPSPRKTLGSDSVIDEIVDAIRDLSQSRTGALLIVETTSTPIDERDFSVPGVRLNAEVSREILQTLFQTSTLLHDGAVLIRGSKIIAAGIILPISDRDASRQLGTRHRAAMGITERVDNCLCIVVSEETGSISLAEKGALNRPLTSSKLRELLEIRFTFSLDREVVTPGLSRFLKQFTKKSVGLLSRLLHFLITRKKT